MQANEAEQWISENVSVTRQNIVVMKRLIVAHGSVEAALTKAGAEEPKKVILQPGVDALPSLRQAANWISFNLAGCEAMWELVHSGIRIPLSESMTPFTAVVQYSGSGGGFSAAWRFNGRFTSSYPSRTAASFASDHGQAFADADLYLERLSILEIHPEVAEAIRDAVRCFRQELFTPSVVMLGKESEGAWIELGSALGTFVGPSDAKGQKLVADVSSWSVSFATKLREIVNFYESKQGLLKGISEKAGIRIEDVRIARHWSETLRDARNAVHHMVSTHTNHDYETVATLLLSATPHFQTLYRLHRAALGK